MKITQRWIGLGAALAAVVSLACDSSVTSPTSVARDGSLRIGGASGPLQSVGAASQEEPPLFNCPRSPGFYCKNQDGNPNMTAEEFDALVVAAAGLLLGVPALDSDAEIREAICEKGDQLLRHLATLALNIAAGIDPSTSLSGETFRGVPVDSIQAAFDLAVQVATEVPPATKAERNQIKDILDRINNNLNTGLTDCEDEGDEVAGEGEAGGGTGGVVTASIKVTICHKGKNTLTIDESALPAHLAHGDTMGPCQ